MQCEPREPSNNLGGKRATRKRVSKIQASSVSASVVEAAIAHHQRHVPKQPSPTAQSRSPLDTLPSPAGSQVPRGSATDRQNFGANSSAVGFAARIFGDSAASHSSDIPSIPGQAGRSKRFSIGVNPSRPWSLVTMECPPPAVLDALVDAYFDRMHWFSVIFHEPQFRRTAQHIISRKSWEQGELGAVLALLMASAAGLQGAARDPAWPGQAVLAQAGLQAGSLLASLIAEVRFHLLDLLDDCCIETVQVCSLLGAHYMFHASPTLAWSILGLAVRTAYALSLHCDTDNDNEGGQDYNSIMAQVRRRNWNHITISDTFAAMIYGRPASLDAAFARVHPLEDLDDLRFGPILSKNRLLDPNSTGSSSQVVTLQTFHVLKFRIYEIIRQALNRFRVLRLQNPISPDDLKSLVQTVQDVRSMLDTWREELPPVFDCDPDAQDATLHELSMIENLSAREQRDRQHLSLQILGLRITYTSAMIFVHRPLLEYRVPASSRQEVPRQTLKAVAESLRLSVNAALQMSRVPVSRLESHFGMSFVLMNFFTAGVILCIPPTTWPLSPIAHESKTGTLRIIRASRAMKHVSPIAAHTEQLLTGLLKQSLQKEVDSGLQQELQQEEAAMKESRRNILPSSYKQQTLPQRSASSQFSGSYENETGNKEAHPFNSVHDLPRGLQTHLPISSERSAPTPADQSSTAMLRHGKGEIEDISSIAASTTTMLNDYYSPSSCDLRAPATGGDFYFEQSNQVDSQLGEAIGSFGQSKSTSPGTRRTSILVRLQEATSVSKMKILAVLFNLVPNDPYSAWTWGGGGL